MSKTQDKKYFALKIIHFKANKKIKDLLTNEVQILYGCKCENIVKCYASFYNVFFKINKRMEQLI